MEDRKFSNKAKQLLHHYRVEIKQDQITITPSVASHKIMCSILIPVLLFLFNFVLLKIPELTLKVYYFLPALILSPLIVTPAHKYFDKVQAKGDLLVLDQEQFFFDGQTLIQQENFSKASLVVLRGHHCQADCIEFSLEYNDNSYPLIKINPLEGYADRFIKAFELNGFQIQKFKGLPKYSS